MSREPCANCNAALEAEASYCSACGQRQLGDEARSMRHLMRSSVAELTDVDGRLWRSFVAVLFRPGFLTAEYRHGRRQRYMSPISLFVAANVIFFLAPSLSDFGISLWDQYQLQPYSPWVAGWIDATVTSSGESFAALAQAYQLRISELSKALVILHVPLLALVTYLLTIDRRLFFADHVVCALHFFAFRMLYWALMPVTVLPLLRGLDSVLPVDIPAAQVAASLYYLYVPFLLRYAFELPWWRAMLTTAAYIYLLFWIHTAYRLIQFALGFWSIAPGG